tara:strand:- start:485 stop:676 length:192 start_codon:yes stop_codon:yes gene_type:complete
MVNGEPRSARWSPQGSAMVIGECVKKMYAGQGLLFGYIDMVCFNLTLDSDNPEPHISDWRNYE